MKVLDQGCCWGDICIEMIEYFELEEKLVMEFECQLHLGW